MTNGPNTPSVSPVEVNPFAPPAADDLGSAAPLVAQGIELRKEVEAFVGHKTTYYWNYWKGAFMDGSRAGGFHMAAFFLNVIWLAYRKMYREFALGLGAMLGLGLVSEWLLQGSHVGGRILNLVFAACFGSFANQIYLRKTKQEIQMARALHPDWEARRSYLKLRGGTNWWAPWLVIFLFVALAVASEAYSS